MSVFLRVAVLPLLICMVPAVFAQSGGGSHDPAFDRIPFDQWLTERAATPFKWEARILPSQVSFQQRLLSHVEVEIDGAEFGRRRGKGQMVVFIQYTDAAGERFQNDAAVDLSKMEEGVSASNIVYSMDAFMLPGTYRVDIAILDSATGEHSAKREKMQVGPLRHDALPDAWRDLPAVEFLPTPDAPDSWFLPSLQGRLNLPLETKRPVEIDVLLNLSPSESQAGSSRIQNTTLRALIPTLKVLSEMKLRNAKLNVELLDLSRRKVAFHQENVRSLDWTTMKESFTPENTGTIDVKSLEDRGRNAAFFVKQVSRKISQGDASGPKHCVIILTGPVAFEGGEDLRPIEATNPEDSPVFYIRYAAPIARVVQPFDPRGRRRGFGGPMDPRLGGRLGYGQHPMADQLEKTLKPLSPRVFDVDSAEQMRKALGEIRDSIGELD